MHRLNKGLVLVKLDADKDQNEEGIFIQEEWKTKEPTGEILAVGDGVEFGAVGDRVYVNRFASIPTPHGEDVRLLKKEDIFEILDA